MVPMEVAGAEEMVERVSGTPSHQRQEPREPLRQSLPVLEKLSE
jgi:hypothetical protein